MGQNLSLQTKEGRHKLAKKSSVKPGFWGSKPHTALLPKQKPTSNALKRPDELQPLSLVRGPTRPSRPGGGSRAVRPGVESAEQRHAPSASGAVIVIGKSGLNVEPLEPTNIYIYIYIARH